MKSNRAAAVLSLCTHLLIALVTVAATGREETPPGEASRESAPVDRGALEPLTIGLMPAVDSIPLIVADHEGYFVDEGLTVTLEVFRDQVYREAALQSNTIDGAVSDLVNAIRAWSNDADYRVLASTQGVFSIVTAPDSGLEQLDDWPEAPDTVETGMLADSIVNYAATRMLEAVSLDPSRVEIVPTTQIPVRMEMVAAGELEAAVLPEPVTRMAVGSGAHELVSTDVLDRTPGVLIVTGRAVEEKGTALDTLLRAYNRAVEAVNADPDSYRSLIVERLAFPPPTAATMRIPTYRPAALPTPEQVADVGSWMRDRGLVDSLPPHRDIVVPEPLGR
ncbi:MAG: ABC transporter substrate-binding protein [Spirochaetales bacterium]